MDKGAVARLARDRFVETAIAGNAGSIGERHEDLQDLAQDLYAYLLDRPDSLFEAMEDMADLEYYVVRMISNNLNSKTSQYYYRYKKHDNDRDNGDIGGIQA